MQRTLNKSTSRTFAAVGTRATTGKGPSKKQAYAKLVENAKAQIYGGRSSEEVVAGLSASNEKVPDFVYATLIDTYMSEKKPAEALNIMIAVR